MNDEELLKFVDELTRWPIHHPRFTAFASPLWNSVREQFPEHPYVANREGLNDVIRDARRHKPLALAMLRELHAQYALAILTS